ncbi:amidase [Geminicoccaceae bacterium 1502E]|nr:amidase [Geminicoccaceae bacterium 1502E]
MTATDLARLSAGELLRLYRRKAASPVEATRACLERIERFNDQVGAYCLVDGEGALEAARASEARWLEGRPRGLIDGVPTSIKDLSLVKGWPTRRGSRTGDGAAPETVDSPPVARLREQGAVLLGKTTTPEFGWKGVTDNPRGDVARNPWDTSRTAGGSSGGAAVAAALGMGALHTGSDGGGSIRMPAGFTGVVGIKPSFGRVPTWPHSPFGTVSHIGPMTRTVADTALMLTVLAGRDARDWHALPGDGRDYRVGLEDGVRGLRIAASADLGYAEVDPEIRGAFEEAVGTLVELGAIVERADPGFSSPRDMFCRHWFSAAAHLGRGLAPEQRAMLDPGLLEIMEEGERVSAADLYELQAQRTDLGMQAQLFFERYDLLVTPTLPLLAFEAGLEVPDRQRYARWIDWSPFSYPFNLTQQPAASVPCGFSKGGLPIGLHVVGPRYADGLVLQAARAFEAARPQPMPEAPRRRDG